MAGGQSGFDCAVAAAPDGLSTLRAVIRYILTVNRTATPRKVLAMLETSLETSTNEEGGGVLKTIAEHLFDEGELRSHRRLVTRQLELRFGELPAPVVERIAHADKASLEGWADALLFADSLAAVFKSPTASSSG